MHGTITSLNNLANAIFSACHNDLPDMAYDWRKPGTTPDKNERQVRRPNQYDLRGIDLFQQMWGSTALGFGGMGGAAMTNADTIVVEGPTMERAVYFGPRFAYLIMKPNKQFHDDLSARLLVEVSRAKSRYES